MALVMVYTLICYNIALEQGGFTPRQIERVCWQNAWDFYERTL